MDERIKVNLIGNPTDDLKIVENSLREDSQYKLRVYNYISDLVSDDKRFLNPRAITIINLEDNWKEVLESAREYHALTDGRLVVVGPENMQAMRASMRLNVHDYFARPLDLDEFNASLKELGERLSKIETEESTSLVTSIINTAGGSGGSFISTNLAHLLATEHKQSVALLDMDVQFGSQALNLDLALQYGISDVLASVDKLDSVALPAYLAKHKSGVHVLGEKLEDIVIPGEIPPENVEKFIQLCSNTFSHTIIDLPRQIDSLFAAVVAKSQRIVLVMQQSLAHVRDTKRILSILLQEFEIPKEHITVLVNRYDEKHAIAIADIESTINHPASIKLPNDYQNAMKATELAKPLVETAPNSALAKGLVELTNKIIGNNFSEGEEKPLIKRAFGGLFSSKK
ncbi:MAG: hypothetical protein R3240_13255 [Gammaproteobacteria bacterium]|nr:hypothetical protein [Gammaproteobacteria bacterium]